MSAENRKVAIIGTGMVGMSYAYAMLNQNTCDEMVLIDIDKNRAEGEAMDLNHGLAFSLSHTKIYSGEYADCADAAIIAICAGVAQKPGETRPQLLGRNAAVFRAIIEPVVAAGFNGIFLVASNPVDIMTQITLHLSGFAPHKVIGTGTALDTARLRYLLGDYFGVDPRNVHGYVMGEHGDSEFVPWSQTMIATKPVLTICDESCGSFCHQELLEIEHEVRTAAEKIITAKKATYYGIGMAMVRITKAILGNENSVISISALLQGEYGMNGVYAGVPCILNRQGVKDILTLDLTPEENEKFKLSCQTLIDAYESISLS